MDRRNAQPSESIVGGLLSRRNSAWFHSPEFPLATATSLVAQLSRQQHAFGGNSGLLLGGFRNWKNLE